MNPIDIVTWVFLLLGGFLCISGGVGLFRFPDFFTRMHAASVTDTLGGGLILLGLLFQAEYDWLVIAKLLFIILFIFLTSPTSSHALAKAAIHSGLKPWTRNSPEPNNSLEPNNSPEQNNKDEPNKNNES